MPGTDSKLFSGGQLLALSVLRVFTVCLVYCGPPTANADVGQVWAVARVDSHLTERWAGQLLVRFRSGDNLSGARDVMLRGFSHWRLDSFDVGFGYDFLYNFPSSETREHRPFQLAEHRWEPEGPLPGDLVIKNRIRLDERFRSDADGVIARLRYRLRTTRRIASGLYLTVSNEIFVNLNDRGSGPPQGFEQNRLRVAPGYAIMPGLRVEFGYEWHLVGRREQATDTRHVLFINLMAAPEDYRAGRGD